MLDQPLTRIGTRAWAGDIAAIAADRAADAEAERRLDPAVVEALIAAGFPRHFVPVDCGGSTGTFEELTQAVAVIGEACAATAWCASLMANLSRMAAFLPVEGYQEVWADGPDAVIVGSLMPVGRAEKVPGGWRVSGAWPYISAVDYSDWSLVCAMIPAEHAEGRANGASGRAAGPTAGDDKPAARIFAIPRDSYSINDTWFNVGMRATGSNTLVAENVLVPSARSFDRENLFTGRDAADSTSPCHRVPLQAVNGLSFATPVLGAARGALNTWSGYIGEKIRTAASRPGAVQVNRASSDTALARSAAEIDAAQLMLERASLVGDKGGTVTRLETMRNLRDCSYAVHLLVTAVDRLFGAAGTSGQSATNPMQRFWRDVNSAASHVALQFDPAAAAYAAESLKI